MTPSKRRRAAKTVWKHAHAMMLIAAGIEEMLYHGAWWCDQHGPTPRERAQALRLATKLRAQAERLVSRIMALECDDR